MSKWRRLPNKRTFRRKASAPAWAYLNSPLTDEKCYNQIETKMANCELLLACPFYNEKLKALPGLAEGLKKLYCFVEKPVCARYMIAKALGREKVPLDLFPNEIEKAENIIAREQS
jgi:hypothetical protein